METHRVLKKYFERKKKSSSGFSLRVLSRRLDISPSFISRVFSGEKPIPFSLLTRLAVELDIEAEVVESLRSSHLVSIDGAQVPVKGKAKIKTEMENWDLTSKTELSALRQWFYLAILELTLLTNYDGSIDMIAERLGLSKTTAEVAVRDLISMGLLKYNDDRLVKTKKKLHWGSAKSVAEIRKFHDQMLGKAQQELRTATSEKEFARRLITGITVTASPKKIAQAKKKLSEYLHEIANDLSEDDGTEVYHISAQLFPLTKA